MDISWISPELNKRHASSYDNASFRVAQPRVAGTLLDHLTIAVPARAPGHLQHSPQRLRAAVKNLFCTTGPKTSLNKRACYDLITTASSTVPVMELLAQWSHDCTKRAPACGRPRHPFQPPRRWISVPGRQQQRHLKTALEFLGSTDRHSQRHRYLVRDHPSDRLPPRQQHSWAAARDVPYASRITGRTEDLPVMVDLVAALAGERLGAAGKGCEELSGMLSVVLCKDGEEDVFVVLIHRILHERGRHISSLHVAGAVRRAISRR